MKKLIGKISLDALAHYYVDKIYAVRALEPDGRARIYDHGDNLFGIHNLETGTITLVVSPSIREARDMVLGKPKEG